MDLDALQGFTKVVELRGFTAAARELGLPKSTLSRKVAELEERLGARLLHRTTRTVEPTDVGQSFYERAVRILEDLAEAERAVAAAQSEPQGRLRLTGPANVPEILLGPLVAEYLRRYPEIEVDVVLTGRVVDLVAEGFDVAIRAGVLADSTLRARKIAPNPLGFFASPAYLAAHGEPTCLDDLDDHACILFASSPRRRPAWLVRGARGAFELPVQGRVRVDDIQLARALAVQGAGIAYIPWLACREDVQNGRLRPLLADHGAEAGGLYVVYPPTTHVSAKVRAFLELVSEWSGLEPLGPRPLSWAASGQ